MMSAEAKELPLEERQRIIDNLIDNQEIKDILASYEEFKTRQF
jgi:hypothetical protein